MKYDKSRLAAHSSIRRMVRFLTEPKKKYIEEGNGFHSEVLALPGDTILIGYFQSERYFIEYADKISRELLINLPIYKTDYVDVNKATSIHVRRGDYLDIPGFALEDFETYYENAMAYIQNVDCCGSFIVFSDDTEWCRKHHLFSGCVFADDIAGQENIDQLVLMSRCRNHIIANSSFSWWGAWLNRSTSKIVVSPSSWFKGVDAMAASIVPNDWVVI
ncbi:alpha-1,2-fucosyltransferase [bacterium]|nr:alpha-1,2-fucosyltransferase [bacterium]